MAKRKTRALSAPVTLSNISEPSSEVTNVGDSVNETETISTGTVSNESVIDENITSDSEKSNAVEQESGKESEESTPTEEPKDGKSEEPIVSENQEDPKESVEAPTEPSESESGTGGTNGGDSVEKPTESETDAPVEPSEPDEPTDPVEPTPEEPVAFQLNVASVKSQFGNIPEYWAIELIKRYFSAPPAIYIPVATDNPDFKIMVQQVKFFGNGLRPVYNSKNMITFTTMLEGATEATILEDMKKQQPSLLSLLPWYNPVDIIDK